MNIAMFLIGGLILLSFPFIVLEKAKSKTRKYRGSKEEI